MYFTKERIEKIKKEISKLAETYKEERKDEDKKDPRQKAEAKVTGRVESRIKDDIGYRLSELRKSKNLTQDDMTELFYPLAPRSVSGYSRIESGEREVSLALLVMIAEQWDVDLHWLLTGENRERPTLPFSVQAAMNAIAEYCQNSK